MSFLKSFPAFVLLGLSSTVRAAIGPITDLPIVNANIQPDGFTRPAVLAGGTFPGPIIKGNKGDHFEINVIDRLTNEDMLKSTSIHWHGMFQHTTAWADGPAFVTQCPITTGNSFNYNFHVPGQAGTYWYHSHLATQYCDGLRGPLIIYDPADPQKHLYDIDDDSTVLTLADWYHTLARQEPAGIPPVPDSTLINGLGRFPSQTTPSPLAVIKVQHGKRYRFRLINIACDPNYHFSIDGHNLTVIETDGINTQPITVSSLTIFVAQRYSFILNANQPIGNYWIRAQPNNAADTSFNGGLNSAILRYIGAPAKDPNTTQGADPTPLNEVNLHPLKPSPVPGKRHPSGGDFNKNLVLTFVNGLFEIDGVSFIPPTVPVLLQILSGAQTAQSIMPNGSIIALPPNSVIELNLPGGVVGGGHPFHLHGHTFWVVRSAGSSTYNFNNPILRDTVNIGGLGDNVTIRFETNNPGPWFLHCHIDWHLDLGFAVVLAEDIPGIKPTNPVPLAWEKLCPLYNALAPGDL